MHATTYRTRPFRLFDLLEPRLLLASPEIAWASYLGPNYTSVNDVALDASGNAFVVGETRVAGWCRGGFDTTYNGMPDGFIARINADGTLIWSSYIGGNNWERVIAAAIAPDDGNLWVVGETTSAGWTAGGFDTTLGGAYDAFIAEITPDGRLLWSTYLGGEPADGANGFEDARSIAFDSPGNAYVTGYTDSPNWTRGGFDTQTDGEDAYVAKIDKTGSLLWTTCLGGRGIERAFGIVTDPAGNAYVTGRTNSSDGPMTGFGANPRGFVCRLNADGTLGWSTPIGGTGYDIAIDASANLWVTGDTRLEGWVSGGFDTAYDDAFGDGTPDAESNGDGFVAMLRPAGTIAWSSYIGGAGNDRAQNIAIDPCGDAWITGQTHSDHWSVPLARYGSGVGLDEAFILRVHPDGTLAYATTLGGFGGQEVGFGIAVDRAGTVWVGGETRAPGWAGDTLGSTLTSSGGIAGFVAVIGTGQGNHAPTDLALSPLSLAENLAPNTLISTLSATDIDPGDTFTYALVAGPGATDNARFTIVGNTLRSAAAFDFETQTACSIRLRVTDGSGGSFEKAFILAIMNVNEAPSAISLSTTTFSATATPGTLLATISGTDPDAGDHHTYALVPGDGSAHNTLFQVIGTELRAASSLAGYGDILSIRLRATDSAGLWFEQALTLHLLFAHTITGTPSADTISLSFSAGQYLLTLNGVTTPVPAAGLSRFDITTGAGDDSIFIDASVTLPCSIVAQSGNDTILGGSGHDTIYGGDDNDSIYGNLGDDSLYGNFGDDSLYAGAGNDSLMGGLGRDSLLGGADNDQLHGGDGQDTLSGGTGDDHLQGKGKADLLSGGAGNDTLIGGAGADQLNGDAGNDYIDSADTYLLNDIPGAFSDTIDGGDGLDTLLHDSQDLWSNTETLLE